MKRAGISLIVVGLMLLVPSGAGAGPGDLDLKFGKRGIAVVPSANLTSRTFDVVTGNDGRLVAVGEDGSGPLISGLKANGMPDIGFGDSGLAPEVPWHCRSCTQPALSVLRQGNGFVVAGVNKGSGMVARFGADGEIDKTWASGQGFADGFDVVWDIAFTPGGQIVIATSEEIVRLESTGEIDESFGTGGKVNLDDLRTGRSRLAANQIDVSNNGSIYVAGSAYGGGRTQRVFVAKLKKTGEFNHSFGSRGLAVIRPQRGYSTDVNASSKGLYVAATLMAPRGEPNESRAAILKFGFDGKPYPGFGRGGLVKSRSGRSYSSSVIVTRRHVIAATGLIIEKRGQNPPLRISRLNHRGKLDRSFGDGGRSKIRGIHGRGMALDGKGRILVAGSRGESNRPTAIVVRLKGG